MSVTLVVARGSNGVIGADGGIPWRLPADLAHFKRLTLGHVLVMGRVTYESIGRPLPGRTTVVVTRDPRWRAEGVLTAGSVAEALDLAAGLDAEVFVVGGAQVYSEALALGRVDRAVVTDVALTPDGDTRFGGIEQWREVAREDHAESEPAYSIVEYQPESILPY